MALVKINRNPSRTELGWFGALFAVFFGLLGLLAWRGANGVPRISLILWGVGVIVAAVYYAVPPARKPIYLGWMYVAYPIGLIVSHVVLALVYFVVFTTVGLLMRFVGHDPLKRRFDAAATSYWTERRDITERSRYFNQY